MKLLTVKMPQEKLKKEMKLFAQISFWEAISFIVLVFVAMPLKYWAEWPWAVKAIGPLHGIAFLAYIFKLAYLAGRKIWPFSKLVLYFIASLLPFAPFWVEKQVKEEIKTMA